MVKSNEQQIMEAESFHYFTKFYKELAKGKAHPMTAINVGMSLIASMRGQLDEEFMDRVKQQLVAAL